MNQARATGRCTAIVVAATLALALPARGQSSCAEGTIAGPADTAAALARPITLRARDLTLREALDRVAAAGHLRLSYSAELLPVDRSACAAFEDYPVGQALRALLRGLPIRVVAAGGDQVVLAPGTVAAAAEPNIPLVTLPRILVEGTPAPANDRAKTFSTSVVDGRRLEGQGGDNLAQMLNGNVPGVWLWAQSPSSLLAQYGSIRGASSFGVSAPKMYIDGIEVANPLLLTHIDPSAVDRVEVIRGPQGGALYGSNSISGVTNIVTRYENPEEGTPTLRLQSGLGVANSDYGRAALAQDYRAGFRAGTPIRSAGANLTVSSLGAFIPGAYGRTLGINAGGRTVGSSSIFSTTFRLYAQSTGTPLSPLLAGIHPTIAPSGSTSGGSGTGMSVGPTVGATDDRPTSTDRDATTSPSNGESVLEYTFGLNASTAGGRHWTHSAVAGVDGYRLRGVPDQTQPFLSPADSALRAAQGGADRATLRLSSVGRYAWGPANFALTLTAERSLLRQQTAADGIVTAPAPVATGGYSSPTTLQPTGTTHDRGTTWDWQPRASSVSVSPTASTVEIWRNNSGLAAQLDGSWAERFYLTGAVRLERDEDLAGNVHNAALPMLGFAWVNDFGPVTLKLRSSYGKGIRLPEASLRELLWATASARADGSKLGPEEQSGIENGLDLTAGRALTLKVTRFDQVASGLVQRVMVAADSSAAWGGHAGLRYQLQNIGRIGNHGWEMQATTRAGQFSATGAFTLVDSRVERVANGYTGELRPGDRALEVPARTASITGTWAPTHSLFSLTAYRALDWVNYDRIALAQALADGRLQRPFAGSALRQYWLAYPGVTHLRAALSHDLRHGVALLFTGDNLLGQQRGEPDNITIIPGRTFSFGVKADF